MEKELLFEGKENTSSVNIKEFTPVGVRLDITVAGKVSGKVAGQILSTHNILMKPGGTSELDLKSIIFSNGEPIFVMGKANGKIVDPTPIGKIEGKLTFQTPSQKLAYLNTTKGWSEALYNMATGEYTFKVYATK
ncbi:MAG: hypothetical protein ACXV2C_05510 [Candidatus Bathyarchaeia archaeon]